MNKKFLVSLLLSSSIIVGATMPVYAQVQTNNTIENQHQVDYGSLDNYYYLELLLSKHYPVNDNIHYNCTRVLPNMGNGKMYFIDIYANGISSPFGHVRITTSMSGYTSIDGTSNDEVKEVSETNWAEKVKLSDSDAIYYARYAVYKNTFKDVRDYEVKIENLSLVTVNDEYTPCYSLKVTYEDTNEQWNVLINTENGNIIETEKVIS